MWLFRSIEGLFRPLYVCICAPSPQLCFLQIFSNLTSNIPLLTCETSPQYAFFKEKYDTTQKTPEVRHIMVRIRWRGFCRGFGFERWLLAFVAFITVIALLHSSTSTISPPRQGKVPQEMVERVHVMIVMCHKHNDGSTKEEVTIFSLGLYDGHGEFEIYEIIFQTTR